jgi:two-component system response regulator FlrC
MATILVVDDQEVMREVTSAMLDGHQVLQAGSGEEALDILRNQAVDLIVSDVQMPGMSGFELHNKVPGRKFLFMTGYVSSGELHQAGDAPLIQKPFKRSQFIEEVEKILGG